MARLFNDAASQRLYVASTPVSGPPLSMACWFNSDSIALHQVLVAVYYLYGAGGYQHHRLMIRGNEAGDPVAASTQGSAVVTYTDATTTSGYSANTWHHALGVWAADNDRRAYIDGGSKGTDATNLVLSSTPNRVNISGIPDGAGATIQYMSGYIAELAIWNASLTDAEATILAAGYSPLLVRPQSLVLYIPLVRDNDKDIVGGRSFTALNAPTIAAHPRVLYPTGYRLGVTIPPVVSRIPRHPAQYNTLAIY